MLPRLMSALALTIAAMLPAPAPASNCAGTQTGLVPLTTLGAGSYQGYQGGLYPGGLNVRPDVHDAAGVAIAHAIAALDTFGNPAANGKVVLISIGMSNCTQEFSTFVPMANSDPSRNPNVLVIDCARGGQTAALIKNPGYQYWDTVKTRLRARGSSPLQAQIAWIKEANAGPTTGFPAATTTLMQDLGSVVRTLRDHFPNIRIAYLSSRIYAGYADTPLNPESYAYESGFAVKWLIEGQINGADSLEYDAANGPVEAPWLAWGPYLWADGLTPRAGDGLTYACGDFAADGTHPATAGRLKVATMLRDFMHTDGTAQPWYLIAPVAAPLPGVRDGALTLAPNPARGPVDISFALPAGERWRLDVVDLGGRRVREVANGVGDGEVQFFQWDGRDRTGAPARAGIYWVRLTSGAVSKTRRLVVTAVP